MALVRNGRNIFQNPGNFGGAVALQSGNFVKGGLRNRFTQLSQLFGGYNNGALQPSSFILPQKSGAISSFTGNNLTLTPTANLIPALPMNASGSITLTVTNAQLDQVIQLIANGVLALTGNANLAAAVSATASSAFTLSSSASLGGIFPVMASSTLTLSGNAALTAKAFMEASAGGPTELSPEGLANAILDALLADHNNAGTVGEALNSIGASGNPWSSDLSSNNAPGTFGERVQKLLTTGKFIGLK